MITKQDLDSAIAECQGDPNPNAQTCMKLASFYTIQDHLFGNEDTENEFIPSVDPPFGYSTDSGVISYDGESEFAQAINGKDTQEVLSIIDEFTQTVNVLIPNLYRGMMRKLEG